MAKKKSSKKTLYILLGIIILLFVLAIIGKKTGVIGQPASTTVEVAKVATRTIIEKVNASGTVQPVVEVKLSPDVAGEIIELSVEEGNPVKKDQLLVRIRPDNFKSALERAQANLNQQKANLAQAEAALERSKAQAIRAKQDFDRQEKLYEQKVISESDYETAQANYSIAQNDKLASEKNVLAARFTVQSSQATVDEAQENLRRTTIYSPVDGTVSKLSVELGERVVGTQQMAGTELMRIANLNNMEVRVDVNENDIIRISIGDTAIIEVDSYTYMEKEFKGVVTAIANTAKEKASQDAVTEFEVKVQILNNSYKDLIKDGKSPFRPGMTANVEILTNRLENVLAVPLSSVTLRVPISKNDSIKQEKTVAEMSSKNKDKEVVFVLQEDKTVKMIAVKTGISDFEFIQIIEGLEANTQVIKGPFLAISKTLNDGDLVEVKNKEKEKE